MKAVNPKIQDSEYASKRQQERTHAGVYAETQSTVQLQELQEFADKSATVIQLLHYQNASQSETIVQRAAGALSKLGDFSGPSKPKNVSPVSSPFASVDAFIAQQNQEARVKAHEVRDQGPSRKDERKAASAALSHHVHDYKKKMATGALVGGGKGLVKSAGKYGGAVGGAVLGGLAGAPAGPAGIAVGGTIGGLVGASLGAGTAAGAISVGQDVYNNKGKASEDQKSASKIIKSAGFNATKDAAATAGEGVAKVASVATGPAAPFVAPVAGTIADKGIKTMFDKAAGVKKTKDIREQKPPTKTKALVDELMAQQNQLDQARAKEHPYAAAILPKRGAKGMSKMQKLMQWGNKKVWRGLEHTFEKGLSEGPETVSKAYLNDDEAQQGGSQEPLDGAQSQTLGEAFGDQAQDEFVPTSVSKGLSSIENVTDLLGAAGKSLSGTYDGYKTAGKAYDKKKGELERQKDQAFGLDTVGRKGGLETTSL